MLSHLSLLRRLELYSNPLDREQSYPDVLLKAQPSLAQVDHMRQAVGELASGMNGAVSRRSVAEAIDAVANAALAQHTVCNHFPNSGPYRTSAAYVPSLMLRWSRSILRGSAPRTRRC